MLIGVIAQSRAQFWSPRLHWVLNMTSTILSFDIVLAASRGNA
jgi:hypothetical protein